MYNVFIFAQHNREAPQWTAMNWKNEMWGKTSMP